MNTCPSCEYTGNEENTLYCQKCGYFYSSRESQTSGFINKVFKGKSFKIRLLLEFLLNSLLFLIYLYSYDTFDYFFYYSSFIILFVSVLLTVRYEINKSISDKKNRKVIDAVIARRRELFISYALKDN